jgi:hypothetical protein
MKLPATYAAAAKLLHAVLARYGSASCDTPNMFETLLRKQGRGFPQEVDVLVAALRHGIVTDLRGKTPGAPDALARVLSVSARMSPPQAAWAVEAWASALAAAPATVATSPRADAEPPRSTTPLRAALVLAGAAVTGSLAYLIWAP